MEKHGLVSGADGEWISDNFFTNRIIHLVSVKSESKSSKRKGERVESFQSHG
jgi:hypothetical protein